MVMEYAGDVLGRLLGIRRSDGRDALVAFAVLASMMAGHALLETARDALFLSKLSAARLPLAYIAIAGLALIVGAVNRRVLARYSTRRALSATLIIGTIVTAGFWSALGDAVPWLLGAFYVWVGLLATVVVLQFWLQLAEVFDVAQAKRVFSVVGAGGLVGATVGSVTASLVLTAAGPRHLLLVATGFFLVAAIAPYGFTKPAPKTSRRRRNQKNTGRRTRHFANPYLVRLFTVALVSAVLITGVDYLFKASIARDTAPEDLGSFFARFYAVLNAISLLVQLAVAPRLLRILGVNRTLLFLPGLLLLGSTGLAIFGGLLPALLLKGADGTFRHSLNRTSTEILYLPLAQEVRARFKTFVDAVGQRGGQALASVALLGATFLGATESHIAIALIGLAGVWLLVVKGLEPYYLELFRKQLRDGMIETQVAVPALDLHSLEALVAALSADNDDEVNAALDLFAAFGKTNLIPALILYHPSQKVVLRAFALFDATDRGDVLRLAARMLDHDDPEIRAAALRLFASVEDPAKLLEQHASADSPELRAVALAWQARHGLVSDEVVAEKLRAMVESDDRRERFAAVYAVRDLPVDRFSWVALALAQNADTEMGPLVARAMADAPSKAYLPALIGLLAHRSGRAPARLALLKLEDAALDALQMALKKADTPRAIRRHIPRTISRFPGGRPARILSDQLIVETDERVLFKILRGLSKMRSDGAAEEVDRTVLFSLTKQTVERAIEALFWRLCVDHFLEVVPEAKTPASMLLLQLARERESFALRRAFMLLHIIEPTDDFKMIAFGLRSEDTKTRATSRELLSHVVQPPLRDVILHMVDDIDDRTKLESTRHFFDPRHRQRYFAAQDEPSALRTAYAEVLTQMLRNVEGTLPGVVAFHMDELGLSEIEATVSPAANARRTLASMAERARELLDIRPFEPAGTE